MGRIIRLFIQREFRRRLSWHSRSGFSYYIIFRLLQRHNNDMLYRYGSRPRAICLRGGGGDDSVFRTKWLTTFVWLAVTHLQWPSTRFNININFDGMYCLPILFWRFGSQLVINFQVPMLRSRELDDGQIKRCRCKLLKFKKVLW